MLRLRPLQLDSFDRAQADRFVEQLATFLREQFDDAAASPWDELCAGIRPALDKAASYGLEDEQQQAIFVTCCWLLGADFDTSHPAAQTVLTSAEATAAEKAAWLERYCREIFERLEES